MSLMQYVFVYGSLKQGFHNNHVLEDSEFIKKIALKGISLHEGPGFPFAQKQPNARTEGEIYKVSSKVLKHLDHLEGHPNWYVRKSFKIGGLSKVWIYLNPEEAAEQPVIKNGRWEHK